jgi:flagellar L-ring protein precursor FlgH
MKSQTCGIRAGALALLLLPALWGCSAPLATQSPPAAQSQAVSGAMPAAYRAPVPAEGSLWHGGGELLFADVKARTIGDTVTIDIIENTSSEIDANTKADRSSSIDASIESALGLMESLYAKNNYLGRDLQGNITGQLFKAQMGSEFEGNGSSDRSGRITASIGAQVTEVLPNGNLVLFGRREMKVNNEVQFIVVSGVARPEDVGSDNRVKSVYLADARIEYYGRGVLADKQKPGWGTRLLDHIWPF